MIDFTELDTAGFDAFATPDCLYTSASGGDAVAVQAVLAGGDRIEPGLGGAGWQAPSLTADLLATEVATDPSPVASPGGGERSARLTVPSGAFAGSYTIRNATRSHTGGTWRCSLERL